MKGRPILFSGPMVRALLAGTKTVTRRVVKPQPRVVDVAPRFAPNTWGFYGDAPPIGSKSAKQLGGWPENGRVVRCPYGDPGERLWVRETWFSDALRSSDDGNVIPDREECVYYRADADRALAEDMEGCWRPSIHMPRWASRITLEITGVRVERLQEITEEEVVREGIPRSTNIFEQTTSEAFEQLWREINGDESWEANPWVWAVSFRRITP